MGNKKTAEKSGSGHLLKGVFLAALLLLFCWQVVQASWFFNLEIVEVFGAETLSTRQIEELAGVWRGAQLLKLDLKEIERRIIADPRITGAVVTRHLPNKLRIQVDENIGLAVIPYCDGFVEIDRSGTVVSIVKNFSRVNLPIITGVPLRTVMLGDKLSGLEAEAARVVAAAIPGSIRPAISEINVSETGDVNITTVTGVRIKFGKSHNAAPRLALLPAVLYAYEVRGLSRVTVDHIDMTGDIPVYKGR